ncbi:GlxA family transcriptional regulator [Algoriphagus pacificus]|uniref:Helix-turn-helix domain-containing protein n=1 Tax=Algoriphagus pacificus TaxID=2811234 RepID=A0ABS3CFI1_9BACT|nr:helix-turn-helix domain-containing protein [Algoriphagus pacificus]MBN7814891.1 helix-turn-helix domain-containing protein [Algoriphagus pacificus]
MKKIYILALENSVLQVIAGTQYCFATINQFQLQAGKEAAFDVKLLGLKNQVFPFGPNFAVTPDLLLEETEKADLIIIPPLFGDIPTAIESNKEFLPWMTEQYHQGTEIASLCLGAFFLGATGLLDGKKVSTHWGFTDLFREMYPEVDVQDGSIVTEESGIYSSGGANSYWNLLLHLVEKYTDRDTAITLSKYFAIDIDRNSQSAFAIFSGQKAHQDEAIKKAQELIEEMIEDKISVDTLADKVAVGRRSFERRFKRVTNNSVLEYIQRVKIEAAKRSFESTMKNISEVMFDVGYSDTKAFRTTFKKITGLTPLEYRNKYNKLPQN